MRFYFCFCIAGRKIVRLSSTSSNSFVGCRIYSLPPTATTVFSEDRWTTSNKCSRSQQVDGLVDDVNIAASYAEFFAKLVLAIVMSAALSLNMNMMNWVTG